MSTGNDDHKVLQAEAFKEAFGAELAPKFEALKEKMDKTRFDIYVAQVAALAPSLVEVAELAKGVPNFWRTSLLNCSDIANLVPKVDHEAFAALTDVTIVHKADVREFDVVFSFSENPHFTNSTLTLSFTPFPPTTGADAPEPYEISPDLFLTPSSTPIAWKSDEANLLKIAPVVDLDAIGEDDDFVIDEEKGTGSFFHFFERAGEDEEELGEALLEWREHALEYATGSDSDWGDDDDDEDDDDEEMDVKV